MKHQRQEEGKKIVGWVVLEWTGEGNACKEIKSWSNVLLTWSACLRTQKKGIMERLFGGHRSDEMPNQGASVG